MKSGDKASVQQIRQPLRRTIETFLLLCGVGLLVWRGLWPWLEVRKEFMFIETIFLWLAAYLTLKITE
jgi:hypothetical protein